MTRVRLYKADDCSLGARALEVVRAAQAELGFERGVVDRGGDRPLPRRYREHLPVVEIDGSRAFTYFVEPHALREKLSE